MASVYDIGFLQEHASRVITGIKDEIHKLFKPVDHTQIAKPTSIDANFLHVLSKCAELRLMEEDLGPKICFYAAYSGAERAALKAELTAKIEAYNLTRQQIANHNAAIIFELRGSGTDSVKEEVLSDDLRLMKRPKGERFGLKSLLLYTGGDFYQVLDIFQNYPMMTLGQKDVEDVLERLGTGTGSITLPDCTDGYRYSVSSVPTTPGAGIELNGLKIRVYNPVPTGSAGSGLIYMDKKRVYSRDSKEVQLLLRTIVQYIEANYANFGFTDKVAARPIAEAATPEAKMAAVEALFKRLATHGTSYRFVLVDPTTTFNQGCYDLNNGSRAVFLGTSRDLQFTPPAAAQAAKAPLFETLAFMASKGLVGAADSFILNGVAVDGPHAGRKTCIKLTSLEHDLAYRLTLGCDNDASWRVRMDLIAHGNKDHFGSREEQAFVQSGTPAERVESFISMANTFFHPKLHEMKKLVLGLVGGKEHRELVNYVKANYTALRDTTSELYSTYSKAKDGKLFLDAVAKAQDIDKAVKFFIGLTATIASKPGLHHYQQNKKSLLAKFVEVVALVRKDCVPASKPVPVMGGAGAPAPKSQASKLCRNGASCKYLRSNGGKDNCYFAH